MSHKLTPEQLANEAHRVVLTAIIHNREGKFLILKRAATKKKFPSLWTVPGGGLKVEDWVNQPETFDGQHYESIEAGLMREVAEEAGVVIKRPNYLLSISFFRDPAGDEPVVTLSYYAEYVSGQVKMADGENVDAAWVSFEEAKGYDLIPGILGELEMVDAIVNGGKSLADIQYKAATEKLKKPTR